jgi:hypothetical protein
VFARSDKVVLKINFNNFFIFLWVRPSTIHKHPETLTLILNPFHQPSLIQPFGQYQISANNDPTIFLQQREHHQLLSELFKLLLTQLQNIKQNKRAKHCFGLD